MSLDYHSCSAQFLIYIYIYIYTCTCDLIILMKFRDSFFEDLVTPAIERGLGGNLELSGYLPTCSFSSSVQMYSMYFSRLLFGFFLTCWHVFLVSLYNVVQSYQCFVTFSWRCSYLLGVAYNYMLIS